MVKETEKEENEETEEEIDKKLEESLLDYTGFLMKATDKVIDRIAKKQGLNEEETRSLQLAWTIMRFQRILTSIIACNENDDEGYKQRGRNMLKIELSSMMSEENAKSFSEKLIK